MSGLVRKNSLNHVPIAGRETKYCECWFTSMSNWRPLPTTPPAPLRPAAHFDDGFQHSRPFWILYAKVRIKIEHIKTCDIQDYEIYARIVDNRVEMNDVPVSPMKEGVIAAWSWSCRVWNRAVTGTTRNFTLTREGLYNAMDVSTNWWCFQLTRRSL